MLKDLLLGLHGLHSSGIAHGNPHPKNLLADLPSTVDVDDATTYQRTGWMTTGRSDPLEREDGLLEDQWAPKHLYHSEPLSAVRRIRSPPSMKLGDLGTSKFICGAQSIWKHRFHCGNNADGPTFPAFRFDSPPTEPTMPQPLRAPEVILGEPFDHKADIWAFGCVVWYFVFTNPLFYTRPIVVEEEIHQDHYLLQMTQALGPLPRNLFDKWPAREDFFDPDGTLVSVRLFCDDTGPDPDIKLPIDEELKTLELPGMGEKDKVQILEILRWTLSYDSTKRPSTAELLKHEWFRESSE
jgi:serine/threonine protein kinase